MEITLGPTGRSITRSVQTTDGKAAMDYVVVAFASDRSKWGIATRFIRTARPDQSGSFVIDGLPPGEYLLPALEYLEPGEENDSELLERLRPFAAGSL